jgi:hypothetical protein
MKKEVMIVEFALLQDAQGQEGKVRFEPLRAHEPGELDMIKAIIIGHVWCGKLDKPHAQKEQEKKCDRNKPFLHKDTLCAGSRSSGGLVILQTIFL